MWMTTIVSAVLGIVWFMFGTLISKGAPQSAAVAAQALVLAVVPYVIARASAEMAQEKRRKEEED
jgi:hypothetical protein